MGQPQLGLGEFVLLHVPQVKTCGYSRSVASRPLTLTFGRFATADPGASSCCRLIHNFETCGYSRSGRFATVDRSILSR